MHLAEIIKIKASEKIELAIRRHWITFMPTIGLFTLLALVPIAVYYIFGQTAPDLISAEYPRAFIVLMFSVYELTIMLVFYSSFLMYYLDMIIITSDRVVQIQQKTLFSRSVSELDIYKIQDTTSEITGIVATILGYGKLTIETAGEQENFIFDACPHVNDVRRTMMQLAKENPKFRTAEGGARVQQP